MCMKAYGCGRRACSAPNCQPYHLLTATTSTSIPPTFGIPHPIPHHPPRHQWRRQKQQQLDSRVDLSGPTHFTACCHCRQGHLTTKEADRLDLNEGTWSIEDLLCPVDPAKWNPVNRHVPLFDPDWHVGVVKSGWRCSGRSASDLVISKEGIWSFAASGQ